MIRIALGALLLVLLSSALEAQVDVPLVRRPLADTLTIDGIPCGPTGKVSAEFFRSGRLHSCPIARALTMSGHELPAATWLQFDEDGTLISAWLPHDSVLAGHLCKGTGYKGWSVRFRPGGALSLCYLAQVTEVDGVPCQRGTFWNEIRGGTRTSVSFHENGRLARCQAARGFERDGVAIRKWDVVRLDGEGRLLPRG